MSGYEEADLKRCRAWNSPVSVLRLLQKLHQVSRLQREVPGFMRLVGQLHPEAATVTLCSTQTPH